MNNNSKNLIITNLLIAVFALSIAQLDVNYRLVVFRVGLLIVLFTIIYIIFSTENSIKTAFIRVYKKIATFVSLAQKSLLMLFVTIISKLNQVNHFASHGVIPWFLTCFMSGSTRLKSTLVKLLLGVKTSISDIGQNAKQLILKLGQLIAIILVKIKNLRLKWPHRQQSVGQTAPKAAIQEPVVIAIEQRYPYLKRNLVAFTIWLLLIGFYAASFVRLMNSNSGLEMFYVWQGLN